MYEAIRESTAETWIGEFLVSVKKGETIPWKGEDLIVKCATMKTIRIGSYSWRRIGKNNQIFMAHETNGTHNFCSDVEGMIIIDLLNEYNQFHEPWEVTLRINEILKAKKAA